MMSSRIQSEGSDFEVQKQMAALLQNVDFQSWLEVQCSLIASVSTSILALADGDDSFVPVAVWPDASQNMDALSELIDRVIDGAVGLITDLGVEKETNKKHFGVAYPIRLEGKVVGVVSMAVAIDSERELSKIMCDLQWGAAWVELMQMRKVFAQRQSDFERLTGSIDLLTKVLPEPGFKSASMRLVTELSIDLNCDLVSLGFVGKKGVKLAHLSHSADFGRQMNLVRSIENAMDEAVDQCASIIIPVPENAPGNLIMVANDALAELHQNESIMTIPLVVDNELMGAITLQRDIDQPFTQNDMYYCESISTLAVSVLHEKRENDRPLILKCRDALTQQIERLFGPGYLRRKLMVMLALMLGVTFSILDGEYRLSADASIKTVSQQAITAPFDGYIKLAHVRAGDVVKKDDELVLLDDRDLLLEQLQWRSQQNRFTTQYHEAIAEHDRARTTVLSAQLEQAKVKLSLVDRQLHRTHLYAPFDGLVVSGDLSQRLGGAVSHGEVLFEVAPLNAYRVELQVKESRISEISVGKKGELYLSALPEMAFEFTVGNIRPVTEAKEGATFYIIEATLNDTHERLRPGMEGVGKVYIDDRNVFSIWTRELAEWARLTLWRWWG